MNLLRLVAAAGCVLAAAPTVAAADDKKTMKKKSSKGGKKGVTSNNFCGAALRPTIKDFFIFGDSFSDTGNVYRASQQTEPQSPPYFDGRYSNGRNYVDFLAQALDLPRITNSTTHNFAWGGATMDDDFIPSFSSFLNGPVPAVKDQIQTFLNTWGDAIPAPESSVYIIYAAYNDYWWYIYNNEHNASLLAPDNLADIADQVTTRIVQSAQQLVNTAGAHYLLIANLVDMAEEPEVLYRSPQVRQAYEICVPLHNAFLRQKLRKFGQDERGVQVIMLPIYDIFRGFVGDATCLGYEQVQVQCLNTSENGAYVVCRDPLSHIFWDDYHPQTMTHKRISEAVLEHLAMFE